MILSNKCYPLFMIGILAIFSQIASAKPLDQVTFQCIQSFEYFAYGIQEDFTDADQLDIVWVPQYELPETDGTIEYLGARILFSRTINGAQEIWLGLSTSQNIYGEPVFGIYSVNENTLTPISSRIEDETSISIAFALLVSDNGTIWASTIQYVDEHLVMLPGMENQYPSSYASVAIFDESTREFVAFSDSPHIPLQFNTRLTYPSTQLMFDANGILWLFMDTTDIYRYDPVSHVFQLTQELNETRLGHVTLTLDDSILTMIRSTSDVGYFGQILSIENYVFELFPNTGEVRSLPTPPIFLKLGLPILVDQSNRAWFSAMAYLENGQWTILSPDPIRTEELSRIEFPIVWTFPTPILADSSGRMWFETSGDNNFGTTGTAWFDPTTGNGCKFTNWSVNIIEDDNGYLWLFNPPTRTIYRSAESVR